MALKSEYLVKKKNELNEMNFSHFGLQEGRFFCIYLSKINPNEVKTRVVRFPLKEFQQIMGIESITNIPQVKATAMKLVQRVVCIDFDDCGGKNEGFAVFHLFKSCFLDKDENNEWVIEIDASDEALPFLFGFRNQFFRYRLWNTLKLRSINQIRMYEILKQYENLGERIITLSALRKLLYIKKNEYPRWNNFKQKVLDPCQKALAENTDICFEYEPTGKKGQGGKVLSLKFTISANDPPNKQMVIEGLISDEMIASIANEEEFVPIIEDSSTAADRYEEHISFLMDATHNLLKRVDIYELHQLVVNRKKNIDTNEEFDFLRHCYWKYMRQSDKKRIRAPFSYFKSIVEKSLQEDF